jgi:hypothetical protein
MLFVDPDGVLGDQPFECICGFAFAPECLASEHQCFLRELRVEVTGQMLWLRETRELPLTEETAENRPTVPDTPVGIFSVWQFNP